MAFGIDDGIAAAAAAINLTSTMVDVVKKYRKDPNLDIELLIEQVRVEALKRIDQADSALADFETLLKQKGVDLNMDLDEVIASTSFFNAIEQMKLRRFRKSLQALSDGIYDAADDISALVRCKDQTRKFGEAVVETAPLKHMFLQSILNAKSLSQKISILRKELLRHKKMLA